MRNNRILSNFFTYFMKTLDSYLGFFFEVSTSDSDALIISLAMSGAEVISNRNIAVGISE